MSHAPELGRAHVDIIGVGLKFGQHLVFDKLSCRFPQGKLSVILGASGAGKSTLLRMITCLQRPDRGDIWIGDNEITCMPDRQVRRLRRRLGMMFQGGALLDSMSVFENVALPLREHTHESEEVIAGHVHRQFEAVGLKDVDHLLPGELSGGMKKRVALARAMITEPEILLCDEPFSGLDPLAVRLIEALLIELNRRTGVTMILTNHNIATTLRMADEIVFVVDKGAVCGPLAEMRQDMDPRLEEFLRAAGAGPMDGDPVS